METTKLTKSEFELGLKQFTGTTSYHEHRCPGAKTLKLTDGCQFVKVEAEAGWLFDIIADLQYHQLIQLYPFQMWRLSKENDNYWRLECRKDEEWLFKGIRSKGTIMLATGASNKEFPLDNLEIWNISGTCLLPSEY